MTFLEFYEINVLNPSFLIQEEPQILNNFNILSLRKRHCIQGAGSDLASKEIPRERGGVSSYSFSLSSRSILRETGYKIFSYFTHDN